MIVEPILLIFEETLLLLLPLALIILLGGWLSYRKIGKVGLAVYALGVLSALGILVSASRKKKPQAPAAPAEGIREVQEEAKQIILESHEAAQVRIEEAARPGNEEDLADLVNGRHRGPKP